jgi:MFS family permease
MQGFGGAMMVPVGRLMVMQHTPKNELVAALSALVWPALVAPVIGPSLGGFIATYANWRWIFFLNLPLGILAMIVAIAILPKTNANTTRQFDWSGFILCTLGMSLFLYGTEQLASVHGEISGALLITALGTVLMLIAIAHMQRAERPMLDLSYFKIQTFTVALRGGSLIRLAIGSAPFLLPLMFQLGFGWNAFQAGSVVIAVFVGNLVMKFVTTPIIKRFGFRPILLWNGLLCSLSLLAYAFFSAQTPLAIIVVILFISGLARSLQFTSINTIAFADIPRSEMASANTLFSTVFQLSLGAGVAVGAVAVRMGASLTKSLGMMGGARDYQFAFWIVSILALLSLGDAVHLARGSGDILIGRERKA